MSEVVQGVVSKYVELRDSLLANQTSEAKALFTMQSHELLNLLTKFRLGSDIMDKISVPVVRVAFPYVLK